MPARAAVDHVLELRRRHPRLVYDSYSYTVSDSYLDIRFRLLLEPNIEFTPQISVPLPPDLDQLSQATIDLFAFHLGLMETISYWKAACPPQVVIAAGNLTGAQVSWWRDLYLHGLSQFFFENGVDFSAPEFLSFSASGPDHGPVSSPARPHGDLLLLGGGKDSAVALELLEQSSPGLATMVLNPIRPAIESAAIAGLGGPLVARRTIDPLLLELNRQGYLNGHTPFSAYLAFLGVFVAALHGLRQAIVANERGAGEESLIYRGLPINHQYSKSVHFERRFREYCARHLTPDVSYFSYLRPLYDLQVAALFAKFPQHHLSFRSCNVGQKTDSWCGNCPKCAYVYLSLFPFLGEEDLSRIFGADLFTHPEIQHHIKALVGLEGHKPFECVGTVEESVVAVELGIARCLASGTPCPPFLKAVAEALGIDDAAVNGARSWLARNWESEHFLPETYSGELRALVTRYMSQQ